MSSVGQAIGGVVGGIAGFFLGGPTGLKYGAQIGLMLGGLLDQPKGPVVEGPRIEDLTVQTSTYGSVIPRVYGTVAINGNVIWLENNAIRETVTKKKSGGKGGAPKTTTRTYSYSATFAVALCEGEMAAVRRIWIGGQLFYDACSSDMDTIIASNEASELFTFYPGSETQDPDPRMQADLGVANTPAYRGLCYIVFYDLPLADYGNSLAGAQVRVEVVQTATYSDDQLSYTPPSSRWLGMFINNGFLWSVGGQSMASGNQVCYSSDSGQTWSTNTALDFTSNWIATGANSNLYLALAGYGDGRVARSTNLISWNTVTGPDAWWRNIIVNGSTFLCFGGSSCYTTTDGVNFTPGANPSQAVVDTFSGAGTYNGAVYAISLNAVASTAKIAVSTTGVNGWTEVIVSGFSQTYGVSTGPAGMLISSGPVPAVGGKYCITTSVDNGATWSPYIELPFSNSALTNVVWNGAQYVALELNYDYFYTSLDLVNWERYRTVQGGLYYGPPVWDGAYWNHLRNNATGHASTFIKFRTDVISASINATLEDIVQTECLRSGILAAGDIDTTALTQEVRGYRIASVGSIRSALEPLQGAWPFDVIPDGYQIRFEPRGTSSVATIPADDLDCQPEGSPPGVRVKTSREMDTQLPKRVTINYLDVDREYDTGAQYAERLNTPAINSVVLDLPIVLTATEAAGKAEVLLYLYWLERQDVEITLPPIYNYLQPGDVITVETDEGDISLRITAISYTSDQRLEVSARYASAAIYTPSAVGVASSSNGATTIVRAGASVYHLLDLPRVSSAQDGPVLLAAMTGALPGWRGGVLYQSVDAGTTWLERQEFGPPGATFGTATNALGVVEDRMIDASSVLTVALTHGELYDTTLLAMLAGANHFAYGADGRWEIIAAQKCTLVSGSTYQLQDLLRGRFGTEWTMGLHAGGDALILLDSADIEAISMDTAQIGASLLYRAITAGRDFATDGNRSFTYQGVNLKPLSPILLNGSRAPGTGDWTLLWTRRSRVDTEWRDYVDAPLGEDSEQYQLDIYDSGSYSVVKRTITATAQTASYSAAEQTTDFGSGQSTLYIKLYQVSATIGRGYPLTTSITR